MSECIPVAFSLPTDSPELIAHSAGQICPDTEVRIIDDNGIDLPFGQPGEVLVRSPRLMKEYLDAPEETSRVIDGDGWYHTGDIATLDGDHYLNIVDRKKDMFIVGGFNAYPAEIERMLMDHPEVAQTAVVGVPDDRLGEVGAAFVVPRPGATITPEQVTAWAREKMANYKAPRYVHILDQLPVNFSGKVLKEDLRRLAAALFVEGR
jgi:acyl-CoA synthetase (AMP-forming)/AMP-acid ligase II